MGKWVFSAFADEYADGFIMQLEALKAFDIPSIELRGVDGKNISQLLPEQVKEVKAKLQDYGIQVSAIGSPIGKIRVDGDLAEHLDMAERVFETANELGTQNIRCFSFYLPEGTTRAAASGQVMDAVSSLVTLADKHGVQLCHENEALIYGESPEDCLDLMQYFDGKLRAVFDMGNFVLDGYDPVAAYRLLQAYISYFHIKDALYAGAIVPAGKGEARIQEILQLHQMNSRQAVQITLEPHLQTFSGLNALVGKKFDNPYKYDDQKEAFADAVVKLRELL